MFWRLIFLAVFSATLLANTDKNIKTNEEKLQKINTQTSSINKKLKTLGENIQDKNAKIKALEREIEIISSSINSNQKVYYEQQKALSDLEGRLSELDSRINELKISLIDNILKDMTILRILNFEEALSEDSIIAEEVLKQLSRATKERINAIINEQENLAKQIDFLRGKIESAKKIILSHQEKKALLEKTKNEQENLANKIAIELNNYNDELRELDKQRVGIQKILVSLNILKKQELEAQEKKRKELLRRENNAVLQLNDAPLEVRQIASSYRNVSTAKYNGPKTIAPLKNYKIETRYGPYFDPVYKMRVFNEFITLSVARKSEVLAVLGGNVVFAKDAAILKKVVIIEHRNGIHTIYSYLDEIPSNIKVGVGVKKGDTIAFVRDKLNFEVTKKDKHINPLDFIDAK